jgi:hypothetical protein
MVFNVGRMLGPAIAGALLVYVSEAWCFVINALSYVAIIGALIAMRLPRAAASASTRGPAEGFWANLGVLLSFPAVRYLLPTVAAVGLLATPYVPLMPSIVAHFFDGRSSTVGLLMSAAGLGALASATYLSLRPGYGRQIGLVTAAPLAVGIVLGAFAWSRVFPLSMLLLAALGAAILVSVNATNALLQQSVPDGWRGRADRHSRPGCTPTAAQSPGGAARADAQSEPLADGLPNLLRRSHSGRPEGSSSNSTKTSVGSGGCATRLVRLASCQVATLTT